MPPTSSHLDEVVLLALTQDYVVTRDQAWECGMSRDWWNGRLGGRLIPLLRGTAMVVAPGGPTQPGPQQWGRAALLLAGADEAALCLGSALRIRRVQGTPFGDVEHVLMPGPHGWGQRRDMRRHCFGVPEGAVVEVEGLRATHATRSVFDALRTYDRAHAVSVLDSALRLGLLGGGDLERMRPRLGVGPRGWLDLADVKAESPLETRTRLILLDEGLPWESQVPMVAPGYGDARVDFLVGRHVVVECDGREVHDGPRAAYRDRKREEALRVLGHEVVHVVWEDVAHRPKPTLARITDALGRVG